MSARLHLRPAVLAGAIVGALAIAAACVSAPTPVNSQKIGNPTAVAVNPYPGDGASINRGALLFGRYCTACHGDTGRGNGPEARTANFRPADLTRSQMQTKSDGNLFTTITDGRGYMPSWGHLLSEQQRWDLINYIRTLAKSNAAAAK